MKPQQTIARSVELEGRGLFTGEAVSVRLCPAPIYSGITFLRVDQASPVGVAARIDNVTKRARRTALRNGTVSIETVEHMLSACAGMGIDNLNIELSGSELPAGDGSCLPFVEKIKEAGITAQDARRQYQVISETTRVVDGDAELVALPPLKEDADTLEVLYDLDYGSPSPVPRQFCHVEVSPAAFEREIAPARTFVLESEAQALLEQGFGKHLTYDDIVVLGSDGPIENTLRFPDECARHKALDLIGDLMLLGKFVAGRVFARKSGHALNHALVRALREQGRRHDLRDRLLSPPALDVRRLQRILPHRYPFLMIDRLLEIDGTKRAVGVKNVTINEEFFQGHYPGQPIMPGVLILEAMAQIGGVLLSQELEHKGKVAVLLSLDRVKFRRAVMPGDQLILTAEAIRVRPTGGHVRTTARVGDDLVAEAEIKFVMTDADPE